SVTSFTHTPYDIQPDTPDPTIYKTNISLPEPLRSVGDVKDKLFRDTDGLWKVERNVALYYADGSETWVESPYGQNRYDMTSNSLPHESFYSTNNITRTPIQSSHFVESDGGFIQNGTYVYVKNI